MPVKRNAADLSGGMVAQSGLADPASRFRAEVLRLGFDPQTQTLGLAVSGGGDSMAMLHLAQRAGLKVRVASVDHGLRAASAGEARMVAAAALALGIDHSTLVWQGWDGRGNLQDRARRARRALLSEWAQNNKLAAVALAHSQSDLSEGFIMRLARGSGVDGLAAMPARFVAGGTAFIRPLLWASGTQLRAYLRDIGASWVDDPSNDVTKFDRVRARKALPALERLGITPQILAGVAHHLALARTALDHATNDLASQVLTERYGIITIDPSWQDAPFDLRRRLFQRIIMWIAPADYPPRGAALTEAMARTAQGRPAQLAGCHFVPNQNALLAFREARRARSVGLDPGSNDPLPPPTLPRTFVWDGVWKVAVQDLFSDAQIGPLGAQGLLQWQEWRSTGLPRAALLSQPSIWANGQLLETPLRPATGTNHAFLRTPAADSLFSVRLSD